MSNQNTSTPIQDRVSMPAMFSGPRWASVQHQSPLFRSMLASAVVFEDQVRLKQNQQQHFDVLKKASISLPYTYSRDQGGMQWGRRLTPQERLDEDIELNQKAWLLALKRFLSPDKGLDTEDDMMHAEISVPEHQKQTEGYAATQNSLPDSVLNLFKYRRMFNRAFQKLSQHCLDDFGRDLSALRFTSLQKRLLPVIVMMLKDLTSNEITGTVEAANCRKVQGDLPQTAIEALLMPFIDQSRSPELRLAQLHELVELSNIAKQDQASDAFQNAHQYAQRLTAALSSVRREHPAFIAVLAGLDADEVKWMKQHSYQAGRVDSFILDVKVPTAVSPASAESLSTCATWCAQQAYLNQPPPMFANFNVASQAEQGADKVLSGHEELSKKRVSVETHNTPAQDAFDAPTDEADLDSPEHSVKVPTPFPYYPTGG